MEFFIWDKDHHSNLKVFKFRFILDLEIYRKEIIVLSHFGYFAKILQILSYMEIFIEILEKYISWI